MARIKYEGGSGGVVKWFRGKIEAIEKGNAEIIAETAHRGEEITKHHIESRGISKRGRVETGKMRDSITSRVVTDSADRVQAHFGWLETREDYFAYQEGGFRHKGSGQDIPGMYALVDAAEEVFEDMKEDIRKNVRDA